MKTKNQIKPRPYLGQILFLLFLSIVSVHAQTNENYVYTRTYQDSLKVIPNSKFASDASSNKYIQQVTYFDGLGRPIQQIGVRQSPTKMDIITHFGYDDFGRQTKNWLPYHDSIGAIGQFRTIDQELEIKKYYQNHYSTDFDGMDLAAHNPYAEKSLEASPLNRVLKQAAPGKDWKLGNGHEIEFEYQSNTNLDAVKRFDVSLAYANNTYTPTIDAKPDYLTGELYKNSTKDENWTSGKNHTTEEFTDKQGRVVLKRTYADVTNSDGTLSAAEAHDTYYVYDDFGNLTYVLPPKMNGSIANMNELGYQYIYDYRNRLVEKRIPGKEEEYIVYNTLDQPILTQDANQRAKSNSSDEWLFTKYDALGRVAYTGKATSTNDTSREIIQAEVDGITQNLWVNQNASATNFGAVDIYYNNVAYPTNLSTHVTLQEVLTINYYDNYNFLTSETGMNLPKYAFEQSIENYNNANKAITKGLATGSKVKVLGKDSWIISVTGYDTKGRPIYSKSKNDYLETLDIVESKLDFVGKPLVSKSTHARGEATIITTDNFTYDHVGRLLAQTQCIGECSSPSGETGKTKSNLPSEYTERFYNAFEGNEDLTIMVTGDSTFHNPGSDISPASNSIAYSTTQFDKIGATVYNNAQSGQSAARWLSNINEDTGKIANAIANTPDNGETTIMLFNFGINEAKDKDDDTVYKNAINGALNAYLAEKPLAKVIMVIPIDAASYSRGWSKEVAIERGLPYVDPNFAMDPVRGIAPDFSNDFYGDPTHPTSDGTRRYWNYIIDQIIPSDLASNITFEDTGLVNLTVEEINDGLGIGTDTAKTSNDNTALELSDIINTTHLHHNAIWVTDATLEDEAELYIDPSSKPASNYELIVFNEYDNLGQLKYKKVGGTPDFTDLDNSDELQKVDYHYNVRGWLTDINDVTAIGDDLFSFNMKYNDIADTSKKLFNGNISQTNWNTKTVNIPNAIGELNEVSNKYTYTYDALNRIQTGIDNTGHYNLNGITYDKNGNIQTLERNGHTNANETNFGTMDDLSYQYIGNQLQSVSDGESTQGFHDRNSGVDYWYDTNGNMVRDLNKGIGTSTTNGISYNHLNLPTAVIINDQGANNGTISYIYDATGVKLQKNVLTNGDSNPKTTDYAGNYIYENNKLQFFNTPEGTVSPKDVDDYSAGFDYVYNYVDHLGNIRLSYTDADGNGSIDPANEIVKESNYYPFGLSHKGYNNNISSLGNSTAKKYGFGGKEEQDEVGLEWLDFGARNYDAALGRWMNPDPLEQFHSPYIYAGNDPIRYMDPTGMYSTEEWKKDNGITDDDLVEVYSSESSSDECPSCETEQDWADYQAQIDNTAGTMGFSSAADMAANFDHLSVSMDESGHQILSNGGKAIDLSRHENRISAFGEFFLPLIEGFPKALAVLFRSSKSAKMTKVGRWMSKTELETMQKTGRMLEGSGGQTFVTTGGSNSFKASKAGSVYVEFEVPASSLLKGGKDGWFKVIGPNSNNSMQKSLQKQGGEMLPLIENLSEILKVN